MNLRERYRAHPWMVTEFAADFALDEVWEFADQEGAGLGDISGVAGALAHFAWMQRDDAHYSPLMAVYVKPRGWFGKLYMAAINPFRVFVVYPALMRAAKRRWESRSGRGSGT